MEPITVEISYDEIQHLAMTTAPSRRERDLERSRRYWLYQKLSVAGIPLNLSFGGELRPVHGALIQHQIRGLDRDRIVFEWRPDPVPAVTSVAAPATWRDRVAAVLRAPWRR